ncbi:IucA/IucC family protein [Frankia sp. R43]|uniref:IucA/IucC family protein n=1 Tax=Frankia sp. R43 TaxID=269536 RepID=UPI0006C9F61F|nr:IucA/IucC family protein [Frankia sp. R43]KPM50541.1 IucA/IucC family protein [Frankia sp. R43]
MGPAGAAAGEADEVVTEVLLRCWLRELGAQAGAPTGPALRLPLPATGLALDLDITYRSPTGWHRFGPPRLHGTPIDAGRPDAGLLDAGLLAALLTREVAAGAALPPGAARGALARILDSAEWITRIIAFRRGEPAAATAVSASAASASAASASAASASAPGEPADRSAREPARVPAGNAANRAPFLVAERALITGHPFHPAAKNRGEASAAETARYSPELHGAFRLHWFAAHPNIVRHGGPDPARTLASLRAEAGTETGNGNESGRGTGTGPVAPPGYLLLPAHPWQARTVGDRPELARLLDDGQLVDLGPSGRPWFPTSSLRTVWRPDAPVMLKLSLGMRITNSRRELHTDELALGAEMARYARLALDEWLGRHHPEFRLLSEPSWAAVLPGGLECALRTNPFGAGDRAVCAAALIADRPDLAPGAPDRSRRSMLAEIITNLTRRGTAATRPAAAGSEPTGSAVASHATTTVAGEWYGQYLRVLILPVLDLYLRRGVGLEAHLQNTVVTLDDQGWPVTGWFRDSQGYYLAASRAEAARHEVPGLGDGLPAVFDDALVEQRLIYYTVVNNALAVIGALGAAGIADERVLLAQLRAELVRARCGPGGRARRGRALLNRLLDAPTLPCKANLRTCVDGRDELVGPVTSQSIYVEIPNPIVEVRP